jgi:hypothetical protein
LLFGSMTARCRHDVGFDTRGRLRGALAQIVSGECSARSRGVKSWREAH